MRECIELQFVDGRSTFASLPAQEKERDGSSMADTGDMANGPMCKLLKHTQALTVEAKVELLNVEFMFLFLLLFAFFFFVFVCTVHHSASACIGEKKCSQDRLRATDDLHCRRRWSFGLVHLQHK